MSLWSARQSVCDDVFIFQAFLVLASFVGHCKISFHLTLDLSNTVSVYLLLAVQRLFLGCTLRIANLASARHFPDILKAEKHKALI
jgi:hypothetical protein